MPASFNFPHTGKLLSLSFVLFAGWYADASLAVTDYPRLAAMGVLTLFGNINVAIPFLLDMFRIPADTFQLFVATAVVNARFGTLMSAVHTLTMALLGTCAVIGALRIDRRKLVRFGVITAVLTIVVVGGTRLLFGVALKTEYDKDKILAGMQALRKRWPATVYKPGDQAPPLPALNGSVLDRVKARKTAPRRVCPRQPALRLLQHARRPGRLRRGDGATARPGSGRRAGVRARCAPGDRGQHRPCGVRPGDDGRGGRRPIARCSFSTRRLTSMKRWPSSHRTTGARTSHRGTTSAP